MNALNFVVLGGDGDLSRRLLLPGLAEYMADDPTLDVTLVGAGVGTPDDYGRDIADALRAAGTPSDVVERLVANTTWVTTDATSTDDLERLLSGGGGARSSTSPCRRGSPG